MILFKKAADLRNYLDVQQKTSNMTGFVPTMGALHAGHISLIKTSTRENALTICSIFINPTQFNNTRDFEKYPITIEKDIYLLETAGCDILFMPSVNEIYPGGTSLKIHYDLGFLETILEGKYRPGHFQGVCMVVHRLLEIIKPGHLYLGQKDYQQCLVITKLIELIGMKDSVDIAICTTLRETDGLAMSSRNMRLKEDERKKAVAIYQSLNLIKQNQQKNNPDELKKRAQQILEQNGFKVDYVEIADAKNLELVDKWDGSGNNIALVAAFMNEVRLIDNMLLS